MGGLYSRGALFGILRYVTDSSIAFFLLSDITVVNPLPKRKSANVTFQLPLRKGLDKSVCHLEAVFIKLGNMHTFMKSDRGAYNSQCIQDILTLEEFPVQNSGTSQLLTASRHMVL